MAILPSGYPDFYKEVQDPPLKEMNIEYQTVEEIIGELRLNDGFEKTMHEIQYALSKEQAHTLIDAHGVDGILADDEELEWLGTHNPELLEAYRALMALAEIDEIESDIQDDDDIWAVSLIDRGTDY